jgi:hypothetical protein
MSLRSIRRLDIRDPVGYWVRQLAALLLCGALGAVAVLMVHSGTLALIMPPAGRVFALVGGLLLLGVVVVRAISLPTDLSAPAAFDSLLGMRVHSCWRYPVLAFPVLLYLFHLPNATSACRYPSGTAEPATVGEHPVPVGYGSLAEAASNPDSRKSFEGKLVRVRGASWIEEDQFGRRSFVGVNLVNHRPLYRGHFSLSVTVRGKTPQEAGLKFLELGQVQVVGRLHSVRRVDTLAVHGSAILDLEPTPEQPLSQLVTQALPDQVDPD